MVTVVNNPAPSSDSSGSGFLIGVIVLVIIGALIWFYGVPAMRKGTTEINVPPAQINVPSQIDVNVNQPK